MVTSTTGMKKGDRRDSGFKWKGKEHWDCPRNECQPQGQNPNYPVPCTAHREPVPHSGSIVLPGELGRAWFPEEQPSGRRTRL